MTGAVNFVGKVKGANLTTKPGAPALDAVWIEWDWNGWVRPQLDVAIALGCNAVRCQGDVAMVINGQLAQATYNARALQFVTYCAANGLAVYYTGCSPCNTNGVSNQTNAVYVRNAQVFADVLKSNIGALAAFESSIIGCDLVQEANFWHDAVAFNNLYALVRPFVPAAIPCTFSVSVVASDTAWINSILGACDFLDYHVYPGLYGGINNCPTPAAITAGPRATYPTKEILFGEIGCNSGGINTAYTPAQVSAWLASCAALGSMPDAKIRGAMMWATQDQDDQYGVFDATWSPRPWVFGPWFKFTKLDYLPPPGPPPNLTNYALAANGGVASASSTHAPIVAGNAGFPASAVNDGVIVDGPGRYDHGEYWNDNTQGAFPDWAQITFVAAKSISQVMIYSLQDNYASAQPSEAMVGSQYVLQDFTVDLLVAGSWTRVATVTGNNKIRHTSVFSPLTATAVKVTVTKVPAMDWTRIIEIEAWGA